MDQPPHHSARNRFLPFVLGALALAAALAVAAELAAVAIPHAALVASRWLLIAALVGWGLERRSLTTWILVSMVIGAEIGHDLPAVAVNLRVLSLVFLRMIKTIIAPLLFATLVVGVAGHSDLKQVGRMGVKALVYFELVTTVALFIGLAAINLSKAGKGITLPPVAHAEKLEAVKETPSEIIQHIFPENIAKSIAEGQVLQVVVFSLVFGVALALLSE
ncbi:MAG TPA: cation:dicarboxylase symporter family transporter, partial [Thermoanaerobaculaceae bacterium]|nr:cation:dicarboxylase symporter family transporter [Thermoanaerobaculaceae bacterium]